MKRILLFGQNKSVYKATAFGYEENNVFCTVDEECENRIIIGTYADSKRACEVVNSMIKTMDDTIVLPDK